jgi:hypothetical protein
MRWLTFLAMAALTLALLLGCVSPSLNPSDRWQVRRIAVDEKFDHPVFRANPLSTAAGGVVGAGAGALGGLQTGPAAMVMAPLGALMGAVYGSACAAASQEHSTANADFERLLNAVDFGVLSRALGAHLNTPRADCCRTTADGSGNALPDAVIAIERIEAGMGCLLGEQDYWVLVQWRTLNMKDGRVLTSATTRCALTSFRRVDDWFANPGYARVEIEHLLAETGKRMAMQLLAQDTSFKCEFRARESGTLEAR